MLSIRGFAVMTNDGESIPAMHLYRLVLLLLLLHMNVLFVRHLRPVRVTRKRWLGRVSVHVNLVCGRLLVLVQLLEKRSPVIVLRKGSRMLPEVGTFDCMSLWDYSFVSGMVGKNILSLVDIEWLLIVGRRMVGVWLHFV